jgi:hypothetical protein
MGGRGVGVGPAGRLVGEGSGVVSTAVGVSVGASSRLKSEQLESTMLTRRKEETSK